MERRKKRLLSVTQESALEFMQEIYHDIQENRSTALIIQKKMLAFMKDAEDLTLIGPIIKDQQKILNDTVQKKLELSKLQASLLQKALKADPSAGKNMTLSTSDRELLEQLLNDENSEE